jgi:RND family efflux transporter MFP subunit
MIVAILGLLIVLGGTGYYYTTRQVATNAKPVVETATIGRGDIILSATGLGTLTPGKEVSFGFKQSGELNEVLVKLGDQVESGQVLARLDDQTLELEYKQAEANLAALSAPAQIAAAEQAMEDAKTSLATAKDRLLSLISPDLFIAREKATDAQGALQRARTLAAQDASTVNQQKVSEAETTLADAQAGLEQAYNDYTGKYVLNMFTYPIRNDKGITVRREVIAPTDTEIAAAQATYDLAKANLSDAQNYLDLLRGKQTVDQLPASSVTAMTDAQLAFDQARANLAAAELVAPISGTITALDLNVGESVGTSAVVTISNLNQPYTIEAYLDEADWDKAKVGYAVSVTFDLLPDENYAGKVMRVYPVLDNSSGTAMVQILVQLDSNLPVDLPAGASASVDVTGGEALGAILVPTSALKEVEPGKYVVYVMKNGEPVEQQIEIGLQDILYAEVKSGLQVGDIVLTDSTIGE